MQPVHKPAQDAQRGIVGGDEDGGRRTHERATDARARDARTYVASAIQRPAFNLHLIQRGSAQKRLSLTTNEHLARPAGFSNAAQPTQRGHVSTGFLM